MPEFIKKPGNILTIMMGVVAVGVLIFGSILSGLPSASPAMAIVVSATDLEAELRRAGLDPESLAAAGVTSGQVATVVADARTYLNTNLQAMRDAEANHASHAGEVQRLRKLRRSGQATQDDLNALATAETNAATELSTLNALRGLLFDAAADSLATGVVSMLGTIAANDRWTCPIQYRCSARPEADWVRLRDALANDRISDELGETPDTALQTVITTRDAETATSTAAANLNVNLAGVQTAFGTAVGS